MRYSLLLFFTIPVFLSGYNGFVNNDKDVSKRSLTDTWRLYDLKNDTVSNTHNIEKLLTEADNNEIVKQGIVLSFFKDGTYSEVQGSGYYMADELKNTSKEKMRYFSDSGTTRAIKVTTEIINNRQTISRTSTLIQKKINFTRNAEPLKDLDENLFYFNNNARRIKPAQPAIGDWIQDDYNIC